MFQFVLLLCQSMIIKLLKKATDKFVRAIRVLEWLFECNVSYANGVTNFHYVSRCFSHLNVTIVTYLHIYRQYINSYNVAPRVMYYPTFLFNMEMRKDNFKYDLFKPKPLQCS